jgi:hypothetical protein
MAAGLERRKTAAGSGLAHFPRSELDIVVIPSHDPNVTFSFTFLH